MSCLECGSEQAVPDAGTCERCGAPPASDWHPPEAITGPRGAELRLDSSGLTIRSRRRARARLLTWEEVRWFRDGWHLSPRQAGWSLDDGWYTGFQQGWILDIVLAHDHVEHVQATWAPGRRQAPPEMLALIRRAAAAHSIPAVLTGGKVNDGEPGTKPGLYYDPSGEPALREWTGTGWSPFRQADPAASRPPGQQTGLVTTWSPLPAAWLRRQATHIVSESRGILALIIACLGLTAWRIVATAHAGHPGHVAWSVAITASLLAILAFCARHVRAQKKIAVAMRAAADRASAQDEPPAGAGHP